VAIDQAQAETLVTRYCDVWNEANPTRRRALLQVVFAEDGVYVDPTVRVTGLSALTDHIGRVAEKYPGSTIVRTSAVDLHHDVLRFSWHKRLADGQPLAESIDVGAVDERGKLRLIMGFFGPLLNLPAA
jgi:hypothetical protein